MASGIQVRLRSSLPDGVRERCRRCPAWLERERDDLRRVRHLEVQPRFDDLTQLRDVAVLHVTAILAQMRGDTVATGGFTDYRGANWIRFAFGRPR